MKKSVLLLPALWFTCSISVYTQVPVWELDFFGFLDNREYFNAFAADQTLFGSRLSARGGLMINQNSRVMAGFDYLYEFGNSEKWKSPDVILFYNSAWKNLSFSIGAFPRQTLTILPFALMADTFNYYRPVCEGASLSFTRSGISQQVWIDWTGRQSAGTRESFLAGFSGSVNSGWFTLRHHLLLNHLAHSLNRPPGENLRDNGGYCLTAGIQSGSMGPLDSIVFVAGLLGSWDRTRGVNDLVFPVGLLVEIDLVRHAYGIKGTFYKGDGQTIVAGDGFYRSSAYARTDVFYRLRSSQIEGRIQGSVHFVPGSVDLSMSLLLRASLSGRFSRQ